MRGLRLCLAFVLLNLFFLSQTSAQCTFSPGDVFYNTTALPYLGCLPTDVNTFNLFSSCVSANYSQSQSAWIATITTAGGLTHPSGSIWLVTSTFFSAVNTSFPLCYAVLRPITPCSIYVTLSTCQGATCFWDGYQSPSCFADETAANLAQPCSNWNPPTFNEEVCETHGCYYQPLEADPIRVPPQCLSPTQVGLGIDVNSVYFFPVQIAYINYQPNDAKLIQIDLEITNFDFFGQYDAPTPFISSFGPVIAGSGAGAYGVPNPLCNTLGTWNPLPPLPLTYGNATDLLGIFLAFCSSTNSTTFGNSTAALGNLTAMFGSINVGPSAGTPGTYVDCSAIDSTTGNGTLRIHMQQDLTVLQNNCGTTLLHTTAFDQYDIPLYYVVENVYGQIIEVTANAYVTYSTVGVYTQSISYQYHMAAFPELTSPNASVCGLDGFEAIQQSYLIQVGPLANNETVVGPRNCSDILVSPTNAYNLTCSQLNYAGTIVNSANNQTYSVFNLTMLTACIGLSQDCQAFNNLGGDYSFSVNLWSCNDTTFTNCNLSNSAMDNSPAHVNVLNVSITECPYTVSGSALNSTLVPTQLCGLLNNVTSTNFSDIAIFSSINQTGQFYFPLPNNSVQLFSGGADGIAIVCYLNETDHVMNGMTQNIQQLFDFDIIFDIGAFANALQILPLDHLGHYLSGGRILTWLDYIPPSGDQSLTYPPKSLANYRLTQNASQVIPLIPMCAGRPGCDGIAWGVSGLERAVAGLGLNFQFATFRNNGPGFVSTVGLDLVLTPTLVRRRLLSTTVTTYNEGNFNVTVTIVDANITDISIQSNNNLDAASANVHMIDGMLLYIWLVNVFVVVVSVWGLEKMWSGGTSLKYD